MNTQKFSLSQLPQLTTQDMVMKHLQPGEPVVVAKLLGAGTAGNFVYSGRTSRRYMFVWDRVLGCHVFKVPASVWNGDFSRDMMDLVRVTHPVIVAIEHEATALSPAAESGKEQRLNEAVRHLLDYYNDSSGAQVGFEDYVSGPFKLQNLSDKPDKPTMEKALVKAAELYELYCFRVGGKAYDGDPLPSWAEFAADANKSQQRNAWLFLGAYVEGVVTRAKVDEMMQAKAKEDEEQAKKEFKEPDPNAGYVLTDDSAKVEAEKIMHTVKQLVPIKLVDLAEKLNVPIVGLAGFLDHFDNVVIEDGIVSIISQNNTEKPATKEQLQDVKESLEHQNASEHSEPKDEVSEDPAALVERIKAALPGQVTTVATKLGYEKDELRALIESEGSPFYIKRAGWIGLKEDVDKEEQSAND